MEVRHAAERYWPTGTAPNTGNVRLMVTYYYEGVVIDVDNLAKPVVDALKGLAFVDDEQVTDILIRKRNLAASLVIAKLTTALADGFGCGREFLHVVVDRAFDLEIPQW